MKEEERKKHTQNIREKDIMLTKRYTGESDLRFPFQGSLSAEVAMEWLDLVGEACDEVRRHVGWYRCKVAALKISADEDALLAVFEQAIIHNAQV